MRPFLLISLITLLIVGSAFGGDYNLVDQFRVPAPEGAIAADPIVDAAGILRGFVYVSSDKQTILIDDYRRKTSTLSAAVESTILKTVNHQFGDTLVVYCLLAAPTGYSDWVYPKLHMLKSVNGNLSSREVDLPLKHPGGLFVSEEITSFDISLSRSMNGNEIEFHFMCRQMFSDYLITLGPIWQASSTGLVYDHGLDSVLYRDGSTHFVRGNLTGGTIPDVFSSTADYYRWDFRDAFDDTNYGTRTSTTVRTVSGKSVELTEQTTANGISVDIMKGDFIDDDLNCDEVIYSGNSKDLLGLHGTTPRGHVACYSFHDDIPKEEWYRQLTPDLDFYFAWGGLITEIRNGTQIAHLDVSNGQFTEVHTLPLSGYTRFFTTGPQNSELNLLTLHNDTLRHYRYDIATPVEDPGVGPNLPRSFILEQNYPNPFNGETVIRFQLTRPESIRISVYNVRGQKVAQIADGPFVSGSHQVTWKPADDIASGVYFVNLSGNSGSQSVRMQYVK